MTSFLNNIKDKFKITTIELKQFMSIANMVFVAVIIAFAFLQVLFITNIHEDALEQVENNYRIINNIPKPTKLPDNWLDEFLHHNFTYRDSMNQIIDGKTFAAVSQLVSSVVLYSILNRIRLVLTDNSTIDKNRTAYMTFKKSDVLIAKVFSDMILFAFPIILASIIGPMYVLYSKDGAFLDEHWVSKLTVNLLGIIFIYFVTTMGMRLFWYSTWSKKIKIGSLVVWLLATIGWLVTSSIVFGVLREQTLDWVLSSKYLIAFTPILNIASPWLIFYRSLPIWTIAPLIGYSLIMIVLVWKLTSKWTKLRLSIQN